MANTSPKRVSDEIYTTAAVLPKGSTVQQLSASCKGRPLGAGRVVCPIHVTGKHEIVTLALALLDTESRAPAANISTDAGVDRKNLDVRDPDLEEGKARSRPDTHCRS
jgi:hypothetical protein